MHEGMRSFVFAMGVMVGFVLLGSLIFSVVMGLIKSYSKHDKKNKIVPMFLHTYLKGKYMAKYSKDSTAK